MVLLEELVRREVIRAEQVPEIVKLSEDKYHGNIDQALIEFNVDENKILETKGIISNIPVKNVDIGDISPSVLKLIPVDTARNYHFVAIGLSNNVLEVGITDPENVQALDVLTFITAKINKPFKLFLISDSVFNKLIEMYDGLGSEVDQALSELDSEIAITGKEQTAKNHDEPKKLDEEERIITSTKSDEDVEVENVLRPTTMKACPIR